MNKKGQVFTLDFFIGLFAFIALLVIGFTQLFSFLPNDNFKNLNDDALHISTILVNNGYPNNWNSTNVVFPGVTDKRKLNITKLQHFENIPYSYSKFLFHTDADYLFFFENKTDTLNLSSCVYGFPVSVNQTNCRPLMGNVNYDNLIKTQRLIAHNGSIITMVIYTWK